MTLPQMIDITVDQTDPESRTLNHEQSTAEIWRFVMTVNGELHHAYMERRELLEQSELSAHFMISGYKVRVWTEDDIVCWQPHAPHPNPTRSATLADMAAQYEDAWHRILEASVYVPGTGGVGLIDSAEDVLPAEWLDSDPPKLRLRPFGEMVKMMDARG